MYRSSRLGASGTSIPAKTPLPYAQKHNVPVEQSKKNIYSRDRNIWHLSHEGGELEDPANAPNEAMWQWIVSSPEKAPDKAEEVEIGFESGTPVSVNGTKLGPVDLLNKLNEIAAKHGVAAPTWSKIALWE